MWKRVGGGDHTAFWLEAWIADDCLKDKYPRLFSIST